MQTVRVIVRHTTMSSALWRATRYIKQKPCIIRTVTVLYKRVSVWTGHPAVNVGIAILPLMKHAARQLTRYNYLCYSRCIANGTNWHVLRGLTVHKATHQMNAIPHILPLETKPNGSMFIHNTKLRFANCICHIHHISRILGTIHRSTRRL